MIIKDLTPYALVKKSAPHVILQQALYVGLKTLGIPTRDLIPTITPPK